MKKLILIGGGGHCKSCIDVIEQEGKYKIIGILDLPDKVGQKVLGYEIIGIDDDIEKYVKQEYDFLITVGQIKTVNLRKSIFEKLVKLNANFATVISPNAYVSKHARIGIGTIIMSGAFLNAGVNVGNNCIINTNALLEHDVKIGNHCHISTSSVINGDCVVGDYSFIGSNVTVVQGIELKMNSFIKANSLIIKKLEV